MVDRLASTVLNLDSLPPSVPRGAMKIHALVTARNPCPIHGAPDNCPESIVGIWDNPDISTVGLAGIIQANVFDITSVVLKDTGGTNRTFPANNACTVPMVVAGTGTTAVAFTDYVLGAIATGGTYGGANSSGNNAATVNAITSNTFTITATITNGSGGNTTYSEIGMAVTSSISASARTFLVAHDLVNSGTGFVVSNAGTLTITYTLAFT